MTAKDSPMKDRISLTMLDGGIADVRLIRADKMNALDSAMWEALAQAIDRLKEQAGLRVVVLSGEGRAFCAGLDRSEEHTSELQSLMRISYAVFCLQKKKT